MTFEDWEKVTHLDHLPPELAAELAWNAATLAERERCVVILTKKAARAGRSYSHSCSDTIDYYSGKVDAFEEMLDDLRGESL